MTYLSAPPIAKRAEAEELRDTKYVGIDHFGRCMVRKPDNMEEVWQRGRRD